MYDEEVLLDPPEFAAKTLLGCSSMPISVMSCTIVRWPSFAMMLSPSS